MSDDFMQVRFTLGGKAMYGSVVKGADPATHLPAGASDITVLDEAAWAEHVAEIEAGIAEVQNKLATQQKARALIEKRVAETTAFSDVELATLASLDVFDAWEVGGVYAVGKRLAHNGGLYEVATPVTAEAHRPPDATGMLSVYRRVDPATGTADDPKTLAVGMAVELGLHYRYNGAVYRLAREMALTVVGYMPGDPGMETFWVVA